MKVIQMKKTNLISASLLSLALGLVAGTAGAAADQAGNFARGAKTWAENCSRCHNMRDPKEFPDSAWKPIVSHMRIRGGLTGQESRDILTFLQASNSSAPAATAAAPATSQAKSSGMSGEQVFQSTCIACHGANGKGVLPGVPDFTNPTGRLSKSDDVLIDHITNGFQSPGSPMAMPPKGGNANLTGADVEAVLAYIRKSFGK